MARKNGRAYASRGGAEVGGGVIPIMCWPCVDDRAVELAEGVVRSMLRGAPSAVTARMVAHECKVGIIGRRQVTTDIPCHGHLKGTTTSDGRDFDAGTRGLGGVPGCATTTVGEENVTMDDDDGYCAESILVHEFGHAVMNCGFSDEQAATIKALYNDAIRAGFDKGLYMFSNAEEFWANGTQAWFNAIARDDVNAGICTRDLLTQRLPGLAALMEQVYGRGEWSYLGTCPRPDKWKGGLNTNGDGLLDAEELATLAAVSATTAEQSIEAADTDKDGKASIEEMMVAVEVAKNSEEFDERVEQAPEES